MIFAGLDVRAIWWREIDRNAINVEISFDLALIRGLQRLLRESTAIETLYHPFEFQPMERALWCGARSVRPVAIVGLQTEIYTANQMGFGFLRSVVRERRTNIGWLPSQTRLPHTARCHTGCFATGLGRSASS